MRFYQQQHRFYCGIDLHARSMYLCIRNQDGVVLLHQNLPAEADDFLQLSMFELFFDEKRILPSLYGGGDVLRSYERTIALWRAGRIDLAGLITHRVRLGEINDALDQMRTGEALRTCIEI